MNPGPVRIALLSAMLVTAGFASAIAPAEESTEAARPRPIHGDADAVVGQVLETTRWLLAEDPAAARAALDALKRATPPLDRVTDEAWGHEILSLDQGFHTTIDRVREYATAGRVEDAFNQFVWVQRACLQCHALLRERGGGAASPAPPAR